MAVDITRSVRIESQGVLAVATEIVITGLVCSACVVKEIFYIIYIDTRQGQFQISGGSLFEICP